MYCDQRVCMSVGVRVGSHISRPCVQTSRKLQYMLPVAVARSSPNDNAKHCVLPVLRITSCFHIMGQIQIQN